MYITPIQTINGIGLDALKPLENKQEGAKIPFKSFFDDAVKNVIDTDKNVAETAALLATGQLDDLHSVGIATTNSQLSLSMAIQLRNKAMDAYSEVMRINL